MRLAPSVFVLVLAVLVAPTVASARRAHSTTTHGIPNTTLIAAAKAARLRLIDYLEDHCDGETTVEAWLKALTARQARAISWSAGRCQLINELNPLDGGGSYCVQATVTLRHPKGRDDTPEIEIYLEDPKRGRPGPAYAFRAAFVTVDGMDYIRARTDFEAGWRERFPDAPAKSCEDDG